MWEWVLKDKNWVWKMSIIAQKWELRNSIVRMGESHVRNEYQIWELANLILRVEAQKLAIILKNENWCYWIRSLYSEKSSSAKSKFIGGPIAYLGGTKKFEQYTLR